MVVMLSAVGPLDAQAVVAPQARAAAVLPQVKAGSAILTDAATGQVLFERNADVRRPIASTTKIMTAILVIENCKTDDVVTASESASKTPFTSLHLKPGEQVKVRDLLYALLIRSANDAGVAFAEHIGGTIDGFAQMMNDKAREIGARNTRFITPNGLYVPGHYSTARDLALIARYALRLPIFNEIVGLRRQIIDRSVNKQDLLVETHSKFLKDYPGADGIKSGYTKEAGYCFVGSATRSGWRLVSVVLKSPDSQIDTAALMDYGFGCFQRVVLAEPGRPLTKVKVAGGDRELEVVPADVVQVAVRLGQAALARCELKLDEIHAPVRKGAKVGTITAYLGSQPVVTLDLQAAHDVSETLASIAWPWVRAIGLLGMICFGAVYGRAAAKGNGERRRRLAQEVRGADPRG